jgi:hypothetical protein
LFGFGLDQFFTAKMLTAEAGRRRNQCSKNSTNLHLPEFGPLSSFHPKWLN